MALQKQLSYYKNSTNKYNDLIEEYAESIIDKMNNRSTYSLDPEELNELSMNVFEELKRIVNEVDNKKPVMPNDIISMHDEVSIVKREIQDDILNEIRNKKFNVTLKDESIKITKCK